MPRVVYSEFTAEDPDRAAAFYKNVFGWKRSSVLCSLNSYRDSLLNISLSHFFYFVLP